MCLCLNFPAKSWGILAYAQPVERSTALRDCNIYVKNVLKLCHSHVIAIAEDVYVTFETKRSCQKL